jgi:hypothetical protein
VASKKKTARSKPAKKPVRKAAPAKTKLKKTRAKPAAKKPAHATKKKVASRLAPLDLSQFPPESITHAERWICLACVWQVFTRHMNLSPKTAISEIRKYTPTLDELNASALARPYFAPDNAKAPCPYCGSASKWHARMPTHRIEGGKATDILRRALLKSLPKDNQYVVMEQKATQQHAFFEWLEKISTQIDLDGSTWLGQVSEHYLSRKEPKVDWRAQFQQTHSIRRSRRLESGSEVDRGRLFLAPDLFDELLLVQYLVSRSHHAGGLTLEGRYTLPELWRRLRRSGYLRAVDVHAGNPSDALEQLLAYLSGGDASVRFYHIVDRRAFLETAKQLTVTPPKR